jgi:hypothetical protein
MVSSSSSVIVRRSRLRAGAFRTGTVTATRPRAGGALRGVATGALRAAFRVGLADLATTRFCCRFGASRFAATGLVVLVDGVVFRAAFDFAADFDVFLVVFFADWALERPVARPAPRRAVLAAFRVALRDAVRLTGELFRAAFLVPRAALRLAIACSLVGDTIRPTLCPCTHGCLP